MIERIGGEQLKELILGAATVLEQNKDALDAMNVFPVPDGDTGTNMSLTMITSAKEVASLPEEKLSGREVVQAMSLGALKGARGNSGVILSQIFAGFSDYISKAEGPIGTTEMAEAFERGVEFAYKAVMKPKEGTILTVARSVADAGKLFAKKSDDIRQQLGYMIEEGEKTLKQTPEMLPVLKEAGVVDAGGAGFIVILMGFKSVMDGDEVNSSNILQGEAAIDFDHLSVGSEDIEFGYCTEFFIKNIYPTAQERDIDAFRNSLARIGDCVLVVGDLSLVKTHVHTNEPGLALQHAQILGELSHIKIDNMREQHRELSEIYEEMPVAEKKHLSVITVTSGDGIRDIFADWQVDGFVEGGQSMNPSTEDIMKAIEVSNAENIILLPNNKNIILAAEQAADMSDKNVVVIKTTTIPQGIAAAVAYDPDRNAEENTEAMEKAVSHVKTGQITNAVRNTTMAGKEIREGELIGIADGKIIENGDKLEDVALALLGDITDGDSELITLYYGEGASEEEANALMGLVEERFKQMDVEVMYGGQPVYQYLISVE